MKTYQKLLSIILLSFANILNYTDRILLQAVISDIKTYFNVQNAQIGFFNTFFYIAYSLSSIGYGALGDLFSKKYLIIGGMYIWTISEILSSFISKDYLFLFYLSRMFFAIGQSGISHLGVVFIADIYSGTTRTRFNSLFLAGIPLGSGLGYLIAPFIASSTGDWQWVLRITPSLGLMVATLMIFFVNESNVNNNKHENEYSLLQKENIERPNRFHSLKFFIKDTFSYFNTKKSFLINTVGYTFMNFSFGVLAFWMPNFLKLLQRLFPEVPGNIFSQNFIGLFFGMCVVTGGFVGVFLPSEIMTRLKTPDRPTELYIALFSCVFSSVFLFLSLFSSTKNMFVMWVLIFFTLISLSAIWLPHAEMLMNLISPIYRSRASGFESFCTHVFGDAVSPAIIGHIADKIQQNKSDFSNFYGIYMSFYICPFILILGSGFYCISILYYQKDCSKTEEETKSQTSDIISVEA